MAITHDTIGEIDVRIAAIRESLRYVERVCPQDQRRSVLQ